MARYDSRRKLQRDARLVEYIKENPDLSMNEVGQVFNISRTRIYQILGRIAKKGR